MSSSGKKSASKSPSRRGSKSSDIRGSVSSSGKERAITNIGQVDIIPLTEDWPPVLSDFDDKKNGLDVFSKYWGLKTTVTGPVGAKNPTTFRSNTATADAGLVFSRQPEDPYWNDIRNRRWKSIIGGVDPDSISICALTGLPFMPSEDGDDLDHIESAKRTALMGIPISTFNYKSGRAWDGQVLVTHTIPEANRSAGAGSYFTNVKELSLGRLTMLLNTKAEMEIVDGAIIEGQQCYSLKKPFIEFKPISAKDIKDLIDAVKKRKENSRVLTKALDSIQTKADLDRHVENHITNLKNWPTLHNILEVLNRQICVDLNTLFTGSRIQISGRPVRSLDAIDALPTVGPGIDLSDPHALNRESTIYLLPPFGRINSLAFLSQRFSNLEGAQFKKILEMIYNIGVGKGIGKGEHWASTYVKVNVTHDAPKIAKKPPTPPPPKEVFDLENPAHLSVIQEVIHKWLIKDDNMNKSADKYLSDRRFEDLSKFVLESRSAIRLKKYIREMIDAVREEIKRTRFKDEHVKLETLISVLEKIGGEISTNNADVAISSNAFSVFGASSSDSSQSGMSSSDSSPSWLSSDMSSSPSDSSEYEDSGMRFSPSAMISRPSDSSDSGMRFSPSAMRSSSSAMRFSPSGMRSSSSDMSSSSSGIRKKLRDIRESSMPFSVLGKNKFQSSSPQLIYSDPMRSASSSNNPKLEDLDSPSGSKRSRRNGGSKRIRNRGKKTRRKSPQ